MQTGGIQSFFVLLVSAPAADSIIVVKLVVAENRTTIKASSEVFV